jgi:long-chain acyl-CoA synthetase
MGCTHHRGRIYNFYENQDWKTQKGGYSGPFLNWRVGDFDRDVVEYLKDQTYIQKVLDAMEKYKSEKFLGYRKTLPNSTETEKEFTWYTYGEIRSMAYDVARNLQEKQIFSKSTYENEGEFSFVGIFAKNCVEWVITDFACQMSSISSVTFYATLGDAAFEHIAKQTKVSSIFVSPENIPVFLKYYEKFPDLPIKRIIIFDLTLVNEDKEAIEKLRSLKLEVLSFTRDVLTITEEQSKNLYQVPALPSPDHILTVCYTSGTTDLPKGAKLSQRYFLVQSSLLEDTGFDAKPSDSHISYLPLAHVMERIMLLSYSCYGIKVGFISGDIRKTMREDMEILKPSILLAVPRVLNNFRQLIFQALAEVDPGCKKNLVEKGLRSKREAFEKNLDIEDSFYDKFVFQKVKDKFGGRIRIILTGSAPLPKELADDIKILFGCPIIEGYGMTEHGVSAVSHASDHSNTSAGGCTIGLKIKLRDVPEMNYHSNTMLNGEISPTGEILVKGLSLFSGYLNNIELTKQTIDEDGWLHTGDIGRIMPGDRGLKIIDRVKEIFKLSQGEYIAPSKLESAYNKSKYVAQLCVYGDSFKSSLICILIPNQVSVLEFLKSKGKVANDSKLSECENFYNDKELHQELKENFDKIAKENNFNSLEKINNFIISKQEFTVDNQMLTPTQKLVRRKIAENFKKEIDEAYGA